MPIRRSLNLHIVAELLSHNVRCNDFLLRIGFYLGRPGLVPDFLRNLLKAKKAQGPIFQLVLRFPLFIIVSHMLHNSYICVVKFTSGQIRRFVVKLLVSCRDCISDLEFGSLCCEFLLCRLFLCSAPLCT